MRSSRKRGLLVLWILSGLVLAVLPARGQTASKSATENATEKTVGPFTGTVVDAAGKPVAGATVWLSGGPDYAEESRVVAKTTSDATGGFKLDAVKWQWSLERARGPELTARDSQGRIGAQVRSPRPPTQSDKSNEGIQIKLQEAKEYRGRLTDTAGQPIPGATIRPDVWTHERQQDGQHIQDIIFFSADLRRDLAAQTDADGSFLLRSMPQVGRISLSIEAKGFGKPQAGLNLEKPLTISLGRPGDIRGSVSCRQEPKAAAGIRVRVYPAGPYTREQADCQVFYHGSGVTQEDGTLLFEGVVPGAYRLEPSLPVGCPCYIDNLTPVEVKSGERASISWTLKPAVKLQGKVVDQETGEGVPGIHVSLYFQDGQGSGGRESGAIADAQGEFALFERPGKATLQLWPIPDQYINPSSSRQQQTIEVKESTTLEPIRLRRASVLEGIVVDKSGNPVADAEIRCTDMDYTLSLHDIIHSDAAGKFAVKKISPQKTVIVRVRTKTAVAEPASVVPANLKEPLRLVVDEKTAFTLRGTVIDSAGKPFPQADVALYSHWSWAGGGVGFQSHTTKSDDAGKFAFGGLWPGDHYQINISATDCEKYGSRTIESKPGAMHDFGRITLVAANAAVEGTVVDSAGKPLAGVRVFNTGDGRKPIEARSDEAGEFRLQGLRSGPIFVFAEREGWRFTGQRTTGGAKDVVLTMLRSCEPVPPRSGVRATAVSDEEKQAARSLLEKCLANGDSRMQDWARKRLAKLDPEKFGKAAEKSGNSPPPKPSLRKIAEDDLDEALSLVPKQDVQGYNALKDLARYFAAKDPEKALRCAEEALLRARNTDQPERTLRLAEMGALVARLGRKEGDSTPTRAEGNAEILLLSPSGETVTRGLTGFS